MSKFAVVIRHLPNCRPVTCAIIPESDDKNIDNMDHYLRSQADDKIRQFKNNFPEFNSASWYVDLINDFDNTPYSTFEHKS